MLAGKRIVLGVTGGIAAYKAVEVCRRLVDAGAHVVPIMTEGAEHFIGRTTLSALASEPVQTELWDNQTTPIPHTKIGQGADLILVAPATARVLAAYRMGLSTDLLVNTLLATRAPVMVCPAMHTEMWEHPSVVENVAVLRERGVHVVEPESGRLAGGDVGAGRLADPAVIVGRSRAGSRSLVTSPACPSSSRRGEPASRSMRSVSSPTAAPANRAMPLRQKPRSRGARVTLVSTASLPTPAGCDLVEVETAEQLRSRNDDRSCRPRRGRDERGRRRLPAEGGQRRANSRSETAHPRSCSSRHPTSSPSSGPPSARDRCWSGSPRRPMIWSRMPQRSWRRSGSI